tara:strand:- start:1260 stop:2324 length:1065 start_codon:yes stop_codon:yes gene_type:complete
MVNKALLIGINYLTSNRYRLHSPINDVNIMKDFLINYLNYQEEDIIILSDSPKIKENASFFNIVKHIKLLGEDLTSQDFLFMYFSGHGSSVVDSNGDEVDKKDEIFLPQDWQVSYISDDLFQSLMKDFKSKLFVMFDCCNSGTMCDLKYSYNIKDFTSIEYLKKDDNVNDIICISSCGENSNTYEKYITKNFINSEKNKYYGEFTIFFLHVLKSYLEENLSFDDLTYKKLISLINNFVHPLPKDKDFTVSYQLLHQNTYNKNLKPYLGLSNKVLLSDIFFSSKSSIDSLKFHNDGIINSLKRKGNSSLHHKVLRQHRKIDFLEKKNKKLLERNEKYISIINNHKMVNNFGMIIN